MWRRGAVGCPVDALEAWWDLELPQPGCCRPPPATSARPPRPPADVAVRPPGPTLTPPRRRRGCCCGTTGRKTISQPVSNSSATTKRKTWGATGRVDCAHRLEAHPGQLEPGPFARPPRPRNASHRRKSVPAIAPTAHKAAGGLAPPRWPKFVDIDWEKSASPRSFWSQGGRTRASRTSSTRPGRCVSTRGTLSSLMF
jgi:hypothetical protein